MPGNSPFLIKRVSAPEFPRGESSAAEESFCKAIGIQYTFGFAVPWMYRILASPHTYEPMIRAPQSGDEHVKDGAAAYWCSLLHLLVYNFGWVRPDRGMLWWYRNGKPLLDDRLRLISQLWDADGQLDWFVTWLWTTDAFKLPSDFDEFAGYSSGSYEPLRPDDWWTDAKRAEAIAASDIPNPLLYGDHNPLHLSAHFSYEPSANEQEGVKVLRSGTTRRSAILLLDSMAGWYRTLTVQGNALPPVPGHSWNVDVIVKPVGHIGTFRKSAVTGLWFSGRHHVHVQGV